MWFHESPRDNETHARADAAPRADPDLESNFYRCRLDEIIHLIGDFAKINILFPVGTDEPENGPENPHALNEFCIRSFWVITYSYFLYRRRFWLPRGLRAQSNIACFIEAVANFQIILLTKALNAYLDKWGLGFRRGLPNQWWCSTVLVLFVLCLSLGHQLISRKTKIRSSANTGEYGPHSKLKKRKKFASNLVYLFICSA